MKEKQAKALATLAEQTFQAPRSHKHSCSENGSQSTWGPCSCGASWAAVVRVLASRVRAIDATPRRTLWAINREGGIPIYWSVYGQVWREKGKRYWSAKPTNAITRYPYRSRLAAMQDCELEANVHLVRKPE